MHSPRSSLKLGATPSSAPPSHGNALPSDPSDLMKSIKLNRKPKSMHSSEFEMKLKENASLDEDTLKAIQYEEEIKLTQESLTQEEIFRTKIREEAQERKRLEELDRETKRKAAEERRQKVVERIRKQQEEEERRAREAEQRLLAIEQEKLRAEQELRDRLHRDRVGMSIEEQYSRLCEMEYREEVARIKWRRQEEEKLAAWEAKQREMDLKEQADRERRLAALEEKKKKLRELRQAQTGTSGDSGDGGKSSALQAAKDEAARLAKQMRIQNKAKFVSKRIKAGETASSVVANTEPSSSSSSTSAADGLKSGLAPIDESIGSPVSIVDVAALSLATIDVPKERPPLAGTTSLSRVASFAPPASSNTSSNNALNKKLSESGLFFRVESFAVDGVMTSVTASADEVTLSPEFLAKVASTESESELRAMQKMMMSEKRALRLEQKQLSAVLGSEEQQNFMLEMRSKLRELLAREEVVQRRLDEVVKKRLQAARGGGDTAAVVVVVEEEEPVSVVVGLDIEGIDTPGPVPVPLPVPVAPAEIPEPKEVTAAKVAECQFQRAEHLLRQATKALEAFDPTNDNDGSKRGLLMLSMEMAEAARGVRSLEAPMDVAGYEDKLLRGSAELKDIAMRPPPESPPRRRVDPPAPQSPDPVPKLVFSPLGREEPESPRRETPLRTDVKPVPTPTLVARKEVVVSEEVVTVAASPQSAPPLELRPSPRPPRERDPEELIERADMETSAPSQPLPQPKREPQPVLPNQPTPTPTPTTPALVPTPTPTPSPIPTAPVLVPTPTQAPLPVTAPSHGFKAGEKALYRTSDGAEELVTIVAAHLDDFPNVYFTILQPSTSRERQTDARRLRPLDGDAPVPSPSPPSPVPLPPSTLALDMDEIHKSIELKQDAAFVTPAKLPHPSPMPASALGTPSVGQNSEAKEIQEASEEASEETEEDALAKLTALPGWNDCVYTSMSTAAHHAAFYGHTDVLEGLSQLFDCFVIDKKGRTPLFYAALANRLDCVAVLVAVDPCWIDVGDERGDTPLHAAAISNGSEVLRFLLNCEVSPDTANNEGLTPSHLATSRACLEALYERGAMPYCVDAQNRMPIHLACKDGRDGCVDFLCKVTPKDFLFWGDNEGNSCLHVAAAAGHAPCIEAICNWTDCVDDLCVVNKKGFTAAHVAVNGAVLKALYEQGANIWIEDPKMRYPLFVHSFLGRMECVAFILEVSASGGKTEKCGHGDVQGDTALHAACLCGHVTCVELLLFFMGDDPNKQGIKPSQLAVRAGHKHIAHLVSFADLHRRNNRSPSEIFGSDFESVSAALQYYGSRWTKLYDPSQDAVYYYDRVTCQSQWERPETFDEDPKIEKKIDQARDLLLEFYRKFDSDKVGQLNDILFDNKDKLTEFFISLANNYNVDDLSMFANVDFD